jgi:hypothetical protein
MFTIEVFLSRPLVWLGSEVSFRISRKPFILNNIEIINILKFDYKVLYT